MRWIQDKLSHKWIPYIASILAIALVLPSLNVGWHLDDYFHRWLLDPNLDSARDTNPLDIFRFLDGDPNKTKEWMDLGVLPWWCSSSLKAAFWRPVAAITHWLDYQLWPSRASLMHAQSILWFGALILVIGRLYRRIISLTWVAGLAVLLYAIDDAHGNAVGWLANRNVLIAAFFGIASIVAHDRWRRDGWRFGCVAGPLLFLVSLLAKEAGIAVIAYVASYAVFMEQGSGKNRILSLAPYVAIALVWRVTWVSLGYGVAGMNLYTDPLAEPIRYLGLFLVRAPILLLGQWGFPPADVSILIPAESIWVHSTLAVLSLGILAVLLTPLLRRDRVARFWGLGMILSLIPATATVPSDRLLFFVGLGAMGLLAQLTYWVLSQERRLPRNRRRLIWCRSILVLMACLHLFIPSVLLPLRAANPLGSSEMLDRLYVSTSFDLADEDKDLIIVNAPSFLHAAYVGSMRIKDGQPVPKRLRILSTGMTEVDLFRFDERTLIVRPSGGFLQGMFDNLYRSSVNPLAVGEVATLDGMTATVTDVADNGYPDEVSFRFSVALQSDSLLWLQYSNGEFVYFVPPAIGKRVHLPGNPPIFSF